MGERFEREGTGKEKQQLGASLVEFSLLVALVAVVAISSVERLGDQISFKLKSASREVSGASGVDLGCPSWNPDC